MGKSTTYTRETLTSLKRKELQKLAKENGVKANQKTTVLIELLAEVFADANAVESNTDAESNDVDGEVKGIETHEEEVVVAETAVEEESEAESEFVTLEELQGMKRKGLQTLVSIRSSSL